MNDKLKALQAVVDKEYKAICEICDAAHDDGEAREVSKMMTASPPHTYTPLDSRRSAIMHNMMLTQMLYYSLLRIKKALAELVEEGK